MLAAQHRRLSQHQLRDWLCRKTVVASNVSWRNIDSLPSPNNRRRIAPADVDRITSLLWLSALSLPPRLQYASLNTALLRPCPTYARFTNLPFVCTMPTMACVGSGGLKRTLLLAVAYGDQLTADAILLRRLPNIFLPALPSPIRCNDS